jgi:hypothetical protein
MASQTESRKPEGYGNIYTPHAGSMIIQVQRESGLQNRTIVLSQRQVQLLRFLTSRSGKIIAATALAVLIIIAAQAARVPTLTYRIASMQHTVVRLDTLERSLAELQRRYDQVQHMLGVTPQVALTPAAPTVMRRLSSMPVRSTGTRGPRHRAVTPVATDSSASTAKPAPETPGLPSSDVPDSLAKSSLPTD